MQCPQCQQENRVGARFCKTCGSRLAEVCPACGQRTEPEAVFCDRCGARLSGPPVAAPSLPADHEAQGVPPAPHAHERNTPEAERRQLTIMFCDLVDSAALAERLDPEELREVVRAYQQACAAVIGRFEGHIAQHLGDGLLVYFGYPAAHEDDAQRAVRAGLEIVAELRRLGTQLPHPLHVRVGIHTGIAVVGEIGEGATREQLALGETPNVAARLQALAEPDTVLIGAATWRLVQGLFACRELGPQTLKGVAAPLPVYQVLRESGAQSRFEVVVSQRLTPLVGREQEVELLRACWQRAKAGDGQAVVLTGEPGIGKSRLLQVLTGHMAGEAATHVECRCSPFSQHSALHPVVMSFRRLLGFATDESPGEKIRKLEGALRRLGFALPEALPLVTSLLSLPLPAHYPALPLSPQKQRQKTLEVLITWVLKEAERQPVRMDVEDLHWADPSTLEFLTLLLDQAPAARLFVLLTCRPEFRPPWPLRSPMTQLALRRLAPEQAGEMIEKVTGGRTLPIAVARQIVAKTDGVPLFVEELTKMVVESGLLKEAAGHYELTGPLPPLAIPATLQDSLMARLDRLPAAKEIAQWGATLGREFSYELIHAVSSLDDATLRHGLKQLVEAELLYQRGLPPQARYLFKHALVRDAAYLSLLRRTRQRYHRRIAQILEERFPETVETQPELVAQHYTEAGLREEALPYWQKAGERASQRSAYVEAVAHFTKGLELLKTLPDTPGRVQRELTFQLALRDALVVVNGYTAPEVEKTVFRTRELCRQLGETPQLFPVLFRLWGFYINRGELQTARELAERLMQLAQNVHDRYLLSVAHLALGCTVFWRGEVIAARPLLEQAIALYDPQQHPRPTVNTADPRVDGLSYGAWTLWCLGYPDRALEQSQEAVGLATRLSHPFSLAYALGIAAWFHAVRREERLARERAEAVMTLSAEQGFPYWLAFGTVVRGWALAEQGQVEDGIAQVQQGLAAFRAMGTETVRAGHLPLLATLYAKGGRIEEGLQVLAETLDIVEKTGERVEEAELYRLKGELLLAREGKNVRAGFKPAPTEEAEGCFLQAIEIARQQQAKSLELRAAMSLAQLWQRQGKQQEAYEMLSAIYGWFTEGFGTKDLQEAKALLHALA